MKNKAPSPEDKDEAVQVTDLMELSKELNVLCQKAESMVEGVDSSDPAYEKLLGQLQKLKSATQNINQSDDNSN